ncbi:MAG: hypothetical protein ABIW76_04325 [Fibrobacteria bacterium]
MSRKCFPALKTLGRRFTAALTDFTSSASLTALMCHLAHKGHMILMVLLIGALPAAAIHFPDTADLKKEYRVSARKDGLPVDFFRKAGGDSNSLHLDWARSDKVGSDKVGSDRVGFNITAARIEQEDEFDPTSFSVLTTDYGNGAAWHEAMTNPDPQTLKVFPGLQQQWHLKGFAGDRGWLGSGVIKGRYFLVFRATPPTAAAVVPGPLRLNSGLFAVLDTSSRWLHVTCPAESGAKSAAKSGVKDSAKSGRRGKSGLPNSDAPVCFTPADDSRLRIRIDRKRPLSLQAWLEEGESGALNDIKNALQAVPDAAQAEYAQDLSQMLLGEAQGFLVKFSQRLPEAFNWPSWQIQDFKDGQVKAAEFLPIVRRQANPGDSLPAFRFEDPGVRLRVNLYYRGTFHLAAETP